MHQASLRSQPSFRDAPLVGGPESIDTDGGYGFRARRFASPRNDGVSFEATSILACNTRIKIDPPRILFFDQSNLPIAPPFLKFLFAGDGGRGVIVDFEPDQLVDAVARRKTFD